MHSEKGLAEMDGCSCHSFFSRYHLILLLCVLSIRVCFVSETFPFFPLSRAYSDEPNPAGDLGKPRAVHATFNLTPHGAGDAGSNPQREYVLGGHGAGGGIKQPMAIVSAVAGVVYKQTHSVAGKQPASRAQFSYIHIDKKSKDIHHNFQKPGFGQHRKDEFDDQVGGCPFNRLSTGMVRDGLPHSRTDQTWLVTSTLDYLAGDKETGGTKYLMERQFFDTEQQEFVAAGGIQINLLRAYQQSVAKVQHVHTLHSIVARTPGKIKFTRFIF